MRAVQVRTFDGPERLTVVGDAPPPDAGDGILIDVHSAGISFPDLLLSRGRYQIQPEPPFTLGVEAAGVVAAASDGSGFAVGERVATFTFGTFAEQVAAPVHTVMRLPDALSFDQGAGLIMNYQTAYLGLVVRGGLHSGERVLVHGASGGVGTAAVQVAKGLGAQVVGLVSSEAKAAVAREAGADAVVVTSSAVDWRKAAVAASGDGFDLVYDPVGGQERTDESVRALRSGGRLVVIGFADGEIPSLALNRILLRNISIVGAAWGHYLATDLALAGRIAGPLTKLIEQGAVRPLVGATFRFEDAERALDDLEQRRATGKLVLRIKETTEA